MSNAPEPSPRPSLRQSWANLRQPGTLAWKSQRWVANMLVRVRTGSSCCGNYGEPGC